MNPSCYQNCDIYARTLPEHLRHFWLVMSVWGPFIGAGVIALLIIHRIK